MAQFEPEEQFQLPIDYYDENLAQQPKTTKAEIIANIDLTNSFNNFPSYSSPICRCTNSKREYY